HRNQVPAIAASQLEDAAAIGRRRRHPEQSSYDAEAIRMGLRQRQAEIRDPIVCGLHYGADRLPMAYRNCAVRMKICPPEIAGELRVKSSRLFSASNSNLGPA